MTAASYFRWSWHLYHTQKMSNLNVCWSILTQNVSSYYSNCTAIATDNPHSNYALATPQPEAHGPPSHYYLSLHRCHPKNVYHYCCNQKPNLAWHEPSGNGPLLNLCICVMLIPCLPCLVCLVVHSLAQDND